MNGSRQRRRGRSSAAGMRAVNPARGSRLMDSTLRRQAQGCGEIGHNTPCDLEQDVARKS